jgi:hypothetical protein
MVSTSQVRELIRCYLSGALDLKNFAENFESLYSDINISCESEALALADRVQRFLGRVSSGYYAENDLRTALYPLAGEPLAANTMIGVPPFNLSVNHFVVEERASPVSSASSGTSPAVVFGSISCLQV